MVAKYFNPYNQLLPTHHQIQQLTFKNPENLADTITDIYLLREQNC